LYKKYIKDLEFKCLKYNNIIKDNNYKTSDHRPVYAIFECEILKENLEKKKLMMNEIEFNNEIGISSSYMKKKLWDEKY